MEGFKKPDRKARGKFNTFLFLDADQTVESLSALEGGFIEELRRVSLEDSDSGQKTGEALDHGPLQAEESLSEDQRVRREEEMLLKRTGYSQITTLLDKLRELGALGTIEIYSPEVYEHIEEGELYEFTAEIRLHSFHQFVSVVQGWAETGKDWGMEDGGEFEGLGRKVENAFYGRNRDKAILTVFADMEGAEPDYKVAMAVKKDNLLVGLEELTGKATFVAQVQRKVAEGQKVPAARLVRKTPVVSPAEQKMMLDIVPALQRVPGTEDIGLGAAEGDILLRKPAVIMKPLCIYRG